MSTTHTCELCTVEQLLQHSSEGYSHQGTDSRVQTAGDSQQGTASCCSTVARGTASSTYIAQGRAKAHGGAAATHR